VEGLGEEKNHCLFIKFSVAPLIMYLTFFEAANAKTAPLNIVNWRIFFEKCTISSVSVCDQYQNLFGLLLMSCQLYICGVLFVTVESILERI
jgi:hypothetical protein